jgi:tRNA(Phe) wybutosine-synthesizing methylase Tyw3
MKSEENYIMTKKDEQIKELLNKNAELRVGRRILMNLLEMTNEEKKKEIEKLKRENESLRKRNKKIATRLWRNECTGK